jgi:hypothetical protein
MLPKDRLFFALMAICSVSFVGNYVQAEQSENAAWRGSFAAFVSALDKVPLTELPSTKADVGHQLGDRVDSDATIMKRFGGPVEFEGIFEGVKTVEFAQKKQQKIGISMARPVELDANTQAFLHLYPKTGSLSGWKAIKPNTPIKFRGTVTGITWFQPVIYGVPHLHGLAIRVEDAEIVSK